MWQHARSGSCWQAAARLLSELRLPTSAWTRSARELSVGQQQRVAAARALFDGPQLVFADEPTSAFDSDARETFVELLQSECRSRGAALVAYRHSVADGMSIRL